MAASPRRQSEAIGLFFTLTTCLVMIGGCSKSTESKVDSTRQEDSTAGVRITQTVLDTLTAEKGMVAVATPLTILMDDRRRFIVADVSDKEIKVFADDGGWIDAIGGPGQGPGEFQALAGAAIVRSHLLALDMIGNRVSVFDLAGSFQHSFTLRDGRDRPLVSAAGISSFDDSLLAAPHRVTGDPSAELVTLHNLKGAQVQSFFSPASYLTPSDPNLVQNTWVMADGQGNLVWVLLSGARPVSAFDGKGVHLASTSVRPAGDTASLKTLLEHNVNEFGSDVRKVMDNFESAVSIVALPDERALLQFVQRTNGAIDRLSAGGTLVLLGLMDGQIVELDRAASPSSLIGKSGDGSALMMRWLGKEYEQVEVTRVSVVDRT